LSTTNPTWTDPGANQAFEKLVTNSLSHGVAKVLAYMVLSNTEQKKTEMKDV
jgi:hypothetical protein